MLEFYYDIATQFINMLNYGGGLYYFCHDDGETIINLGEVNTHTAL